jgi:hypothetical protein
MGKAIQYGELDADQHLLHDVVLLRRLNRIELVLYGKDGMFSLGAN